MVVSQMTRDQGAMPNLLAISQPIGDFNDNSTRLIGPVLNKLEMEHYMLNDTHADDALQQASVHMRCQHGELDEPHPVEAMSCLQYVGFPRQYRRLRNVETDKDLRRKAWMIGEMGAQSLYEGCDTPWTCSSQKCQCEPTRGWTGLTPINLVTLMLTIILEASEPLL